MGDRAKSEQPRDIFRQEQGSAKAHNSQLGPSSQPNMSSNGKMLIFKGNFRVIGAKKDSSSYMLYTVVGPFRVRPYKVRLAIRYVIFVNFTRGL